MFVGNITNHPTGLLNLEEIDEQIPGETKPQIKSHEDLKTVLRELNLLDEWNVLTSNLPMLPALKFPQECQSIQELIMTEQIFIGREGFSASFSIYKLLQAFQKDFGTYISSIELIGGGVNKMLSKEYLCHALANLGVENAQTFITDEFIETFGLTGDFDFRITLKENAAYDFLKTNKGSMEIWEAIRRRFCDYLAAWQNQVKVPSLKESIFAWENAFKKKGFNAEENYSLYALENEKNIRYEILFAGYGNRAFLFNSDDLRILLDGIFQPDFPINLPLNSETGSFKALLSKILGDIGLTEINKMNIYAYPLWLAKQVKGRTCSSNESLKLLQRYVEQLKTANLPKGYFPVASLPQAHRNIPALLAFHHQYCIKNHLQNSPHQAFVLGLALCFSLEQSLTKKVLHEAWKQIEANIIALNKDNSSAFPLNLIKPISEGKISLAQSFQWIAFMAFMVTISKSDGHIENIFVTKKIHQRSCHLQITFKDAYLLLPLVPIPDPQTLALAETYLYSEHPSLLVNWSKDMEIDLSYSEQLKQIQSSEDFIKNSLDPLMAFELLALVECSGLYDVREGLLGLFPAVFKDGRPAVYSLIDILFDRWQIPLFIIEKIKQEISLIEKPDLTTINDICLKHFVTCREETFLRAYASRKLKEMNVGCTETQSTYQKLFPELLAYNFPLAIEIYLKLSLEPLEKIKTLNQLLKTYLENPSPIINEKIVDLFCWHIKDNRKYYSNRAVKKEAHTLFPLLNTFQDVILEHQQFDLLKKFMIITKENGFCEVKSRWLKCCQLIQNKDPEKAYVFLKEGENLKIFPSDAYLDQMIVLIDLVAPQMASRIFQEILLKAHALSDDQKERVSDYLYRSTDITEFETLHELLQSNKLTIVSENSLQKLRLTYLDLLSERKPIDLAAIETTIRLIACNSLTPAVQNKLLENIEFFVSNCDPLKALRLLQSQEIQSLYFNDSKILYRLLLNLIDKLLEKPQIIQLSTIEIFFHFINLPNIQNTTIALQRRFVNSLINLLNDMWREGIKTPPSLIEKLREHHIQIFQILCESPFDFFRLLNTFNMTFPLDVQIRPLIYQSILKYLEKDHNTGDIHLLLKNSISNRLSTNDEEFCSVCKILIVKLSKCPENKDLVNYWLDKIGKRLDSDFLSTIIAQLIENKNLDIAIKYIKSLSVQKNALIFNWYTSSFIHCDKQKLGETLIKEKKFLKENLTPKELTNIIDGFTLTAFTLTPEIGSSLLFKLLKNFLAFNTTALTHFSNFLDNNSTPNELIMGFNYFLDYTKDLKSITSEHANICLLFLSKFKTSNVPLPKNLFDNVNLFTKIFKTENIDACINAFRYYSEYLLMNLPDAPEKQNHFEKLTSPYRDFFDHIYNTEFALTIHSTQFFINLHKLTPNSINEACEFIKRAFSPESSKLLGYNPLILCNQLGIKILEANKLVEDCELLKQRTPNIKTIFTEPKFENLFQELLNLCLEDNQFSSTYLPLNFIECFAASESHLLFQKILRLFLKYNEENFITHNENAENPIASSINDQVRLLGFSLFKTCIVHKYKLVRDYALQVFPTLSLFTQTEIDTLYSDHLIYELSDPITNTEIDKEKFNLFYNQFKFTPLVENKLSIFDSKIHATCLKSVLKIISNISLQYCDGSIYQSYIVKLNDVIKEKMLQSGHSIDNQDNTQILELYYNTISDMGIRAKTAVQSQFCIEQLSILLDSYLTNYQNSQTSLDLLIIMINHLMLNPTSLNASPENYQLIVEKCTTIALSIKQNDAKAKQNDAKVKQTQFRCQLIFYSSQERELTFESDLTFKTKQMITSEVIKELTARRQFNAIYRAFFVLINTQKIYYESNLKELVTAYKALVNAIKRNSNFTNDQIKLIIKGIERLKVNLPLFDKYEGKIKSEILDQLKLLDLHSIKKIRESEENKELLGSLLAIDELNSKVEELDFCDFV